MKIMLHANSVTMGGGMRHLNSFLPELGKSDRKNEYVVLVRKSFPDIDVPWNISLDRLPDDLNTNWIRRVAFDLVEIPRRLKREKFDVVVSLLNFGPVSSPVPHILFQRNSLYFCEDHLARVGAREKTEILFRRRLAFESMKRASLIVTPSHAMADMIGITYPELRSRRFHLLYHGYSRDSLRDPLSEDCRKNLSVDGLKFLYPTHPAPHKGFDILFSSLSILKKNGLKFTLFVTVALEDWPEEVNRYRRWIHDNDLVGNVVFLGRVPQNQMGPLYECCDLMLYPSLCESFGFSMIEAMGYGLPIVAADTRVNREICGEGANYYPPLDPESAAAAICDALRPDVNRRLLDAGKRRMDGFDWSWQRYSREFMEMIRMVT